MLFSRGSIRMFTHRLVRLALVVTMVCVAAACGKKKAPVLAPTATPAAESALDADAALLRQNATWMITVEGHCDERGTAEYNLALGDRRAAAAVAYLKSLGIAGERLKTVSYGKEFPFDPGHDETAWSKNRRAHFVITAK